ncbi:MAG: site-specific integrase [Halothece sp.]
MDIQGRINQANGRLKTANCGVKIEKQGNTLFLRATLPPKPDSEKIRPYQQRIRLGVYANPKGVQSAEKEALKVGGLLAFKDFTWQPYLKQSSQQEKTIADWIKEFEQDYFHRRERTAQSETTWKGEYQKVFTQLPLQKPLSKEILLETVLTTDPDTRTRKRYCLALGALAEFAEIDFNAKAYRGKYTPTKVTPRDIPSDHAIAEAFLKIKNDGWRWCFGILATFGLRPHELFHIDLKQFEGNILTVLEGKTGTRQVWAIYPEWIEAFSLHNITLPPCTGKNNSELGHRVTQAFKRESVPFNPYDLRHAWAIRSLEFGLDLSLASQQMGHSVKVHTDIYHHWISERHHQRAYDLLINRRDRPDAPLP